MKLNEIEAAVSGQVWFTDDDAKVVPTIQSYNSDKLIKTDKQNLKLYTAEQMQEYAKAQVLDVLNYLTYKRDGNMAKEINKRFFED